MQLRHKKQLKNLELKVDKKKKAQIDEVKAEVQEYKMQNHTIIRMIKQAAWQNDIQYKSTLCYLNTTIINYVVVPKIPLN